MWLRFLNNNNNKKNEQKESNIAAFVSFEHLTFVEWNSIFVTAITASTGREFPISSFWISAHSRNNSNGNCFVFVINICESLTSAERVRAPVLQQHLSYLQDTCFHWKRVLLINYECEKRNKKIHIKGGFVFFHPPLSVSSSACRSAWPWGCWPAGGVVSRSSSTASDTCGR